MAKLNAVAALKFRRIAVPSQQLAIDRKGRPGALRGRDNGELNIAGYVARNVDSGNARCARVIGHDARFVIGASKSLKERPRGLLSGVQEQRLAADALPVSKAAYLSACLPWGQRCAESGS